MLNLHKWLDEQPSGDAVSMESLRKLADDLGPYLEINVRVEDVEEIQRVIKAARRVWTGEVNGKVAAEAMAELGAALSEGNFI